MPRPASSVLRTTDQIVDEVERALGVAAPSDVLQICKFYRAAALTVRAQKEVIEEHARTIASLRRTRAPAPVEGKAEKGTP